MMKRAYRVVDVFSDAAFSGNPVAVVFDADALSPQRMQTIAAWFRLSETVFVVSPTTNAAHYRAKIFAPGGELPFAGHPTLGTAAAVTLERALDEAILVQECGAGLFRVTRTGTFFSVRVPTPHLAMLGASDASEVAKALGGAPAFTGETARVDLGARWVVAQVGSADQLRSLEPNMPHLTEVSRRLKVTGVTAFAFASAREGLIVRSFAPAFGVDEDPVCGSGNAAVAAYLRVTGLIARVGPRYVASQGEALGRAGRVHVTVEGEDVTLGGHVTAVAQGTLQIGDEPPAAGMESADRSSG